MFDLGIVFSGEKNCHSARCGPVTVCSATCFTGLSGLEEYRLMGAINTKGFYFFNYCPQLCFAEPLFPVGRRTDCQEGDRLEAERFLWRS